MNKKYATKFILCSATCDKKLNKDTNNTIQEYTIQSVVALEMCKVCKCTGAPPLLGASPFDLPRAEKI